MSNIVTLIHSRKAIGRAGDTLVEAQMLTQQYNDALEKLSNWRASHVYPLLIIHKLLLSRAKKIDKKVLSVQRLKRIPSIVNKLKRYPRMKLHRLQDIGGCRAILSDITKVYDLRKDITKKFSNHLLIKENDYIEEMKDSGYRGIHLIYKFQGKTHTDFNEHLIEIQLRTQLQHTWATSVEIMGTYLNESLKSSQGSQDILDFFKKISLLFSFAEKNNQNMSPSSVKALKSSILDDINSLDIITKLRAFSVTTKSISKNNNKDGYSLLNLDTNKRVVNIMHFKKDDLEVAVNEYLRLERESGNMNSDNIVLVSTLSIYNLKKAYPNYFADSNQFIHNLEELLEQKFTKNKKDK